MLSHSEGFESSILEGAAVQAACIPASWKYWQLPKWRVLAGFMVGLSSCSRSICSYNLTLIFVYSGNVPLLPNDWVGLMHGGSPLRFSEELGDNCRASVAEPKGAPKAADAQGYLPPWSINSKLVCGAPLSGSYTSRHSGPLRPPLLLLCPASALALHILPQSLGVLFLRMLRLSLRGPSGGARPSASSSSHDLVAAG